MARPDQTRGVPPPDLTPRRREVAVSISGGTDYTEGSVIEYASFGLLRRVKVESVEPDIHKGRAGFDGTIVSSDEPGDYEFLVANGSHVWGYDMQVMRVVTP